MIHFELTIRGQDEVTGALRNAAAQGQRRMSAATYHWAVNALPRLRSTPYPAERPGQRYRRTYRLRDGWGARPTQGGATIFNRQPYTGFVVGDWQGGGQAWMHRGRWWTAEAILRNERQSLRPALVKELNHLFAIGAIRR